MKMNFITFRSVTPAQRGQRVLTQAGIHSTLQRTPGPMQERGCGYCLRLRAWDTLNAVELLQNAQVPFRKVYAEEQGQFRELSL